MSGTGGGDHRVSTHSSTGAGTSLMLKISSVVKSLSKAVPTLSIVDVVTSCRQCRGPVKYNHDFCSQPCALKYWERLRQGNAKASGKHVKLARLVVNSIVLETSGMMGGPVGHSTVIKKDLPDTILGLE